MRPSFVLACLGAALAGDPEARTWSRTTDPAGSDRMRILLPDAAGGALVVGDVSDDHGREDIGFLEVDGFGTPVRSWTIGGTRLDQAHDAARMADGGVLVVGSID